MDFLDFAGEAMYFDRPLSPAVAELLVEAAAQYGEPAAECALLRAYFIAPEHLSVLVALYRFYYYQQRYEDALAVAERTIAIAARELCLDENWRHLDEQELERSARRSMGLTRFLLLALKGAGYLEMRLGAPAAAVERFEKLARFDTANRLGVTDLLAWSRQAVADTLAQSAGENVRAFRRA